MQYQFDQYLLDGERFELIKQGSSIRQEPQVIELLLFMVKNRGRLITKQELNENVWGGRVVSDSALSSRIKIARRAIGDNGKKQQFIRTIHKKGFCFVGDVVEKDVVNPRNGNAANKNKNGNTAAGISENSTEAIAGDSRPVIAVLPFDNSGNDPEQDYFARGITEDIVTTLSKMSKLVVVTYSHGVSPTDVDSVQIGSDLGVGYLLEGSVRSDGRRLRISAHLIDVQNGHHMWAERYDRENIDLFDLQDEVTKNVVSALQVELTEGEHALLASRGTENIEAWKLTFVGEGSVLEHRKESVRRGLLQLQKAVQLDENYAMAWNALATAHLKESMNKGWSVSPETSLADALKASDRAIEIDPDNAASLATRSIIFISLRKFEEAQALAEKALFLANSEAHTMAIAAITLRVCCLPEKSIMYTLKAMRLCPIYPAWYPYGNAVCHWMLRQYDQAIAAANEAIKIDSEFVYTYFVLAMVYAEMDDQKKIKSAVENVLRIDPNFSWNAYTDSLPFSDKGTNARRETALKKSGMPE